MDPIALSWHVHGCAASPGHYFHRWGACAVACWRCCQQWSISSECKVSMFVGSARTDHARARHLDTARPRARACARPAQTDAGAPAREGAAAAAGMAEAALVYPRVNTLSDFIYHPPLEHLHLEICAASRPDARSSRGWQPGAAGDAGAARARVGRGRSHCCASYGVRWPAAGHQPCGAAEAEARDR